MNDMPLIGVGRQAEVYAVSDAECIKFVHSDVNRAAAEAEALYTRRAHEFGIPAPACMGVVEVDGRIGIRFERLHGVSALREMLSGKDFRYAYEMGKILRRIHACPGEGLDPVTERLRHQIGEADILSPAVKAKLFSVLDATRGDRLLHMDFHMDNVLMTESGMRVIDWAGAVSGDPMLDVAQSLLFFCTKAYPADADEAMRRAIDGTRRGLTDEFLQGYGATYAEAAKYLPVVAASRVRNAGQSEREQYMEIIQNALGE